MGQRVLKIASQRDFLSRWAVRGSWLALICVVSLASTDSVQAQEELDFAHDILPVLMSRCGDCHAHGVFKGGLSLESRQSLLDSGVVSIGDRSASELWQRVASEDEDLRMPPQGAPLSSQQIELLGRWIDDGLPWPPELTLTKPTFSRSLALAVPVIPTGSDFDHPVDALVAEYFQQQGVDFPEQLSDRQFLRRLKLDLLGLLPSPSEVESFVADTNPQKYALQVDEFLSRDREYADHWISFWNDLLRNDYTGTGYIDGGRQQITTWLHRSLMDNKPFDQFVRELIEPVPAAQGFIKGIQWRGEVNASQIQPLQFSQNVSQVFLGINMKCASCHDSFVDNWKLSDAYGLAAVIAEAPLEMYRCDIPIGQFATSQFVFPELGQIDQQWPRQQRLERLAELITSPQNGRFSRTIVNRLWQRLAGRGLVHPVDVMANEAWSESLLDYLATELVGPQGSRATAGQAYDLKHVLRLIATSHIYRCQATTAEPTAEAYVFRGIGWKRMTAEQFVDAVWTLTAAWPEAMAASIEEDAAADQEAPTPEVRSDRGTDLPIRASLVPADLLMRSLGRPNRDQVVTTRPEELSTLQALDLSNGPLLTRWIRQGADHWLKRQGQAGWSNDQLIEQLFREALSREPTPQELTLLRLEDASDLQPQLEDLLWMVLMLPEFQLIQ